MNENKIVVAGPAAVGKSALTVQFLKNAFITEYEATIEDSYHKQFEVDSFMNFAEIIDTAGQEEYTVMRDIYLRSGQGFLVVYAVDNLDSFTKAEQLMQTILSKREGQVPMVLVGNKADLPGRVVDLAAGKRLASQFGCPFYETSAKTPCNVDEIFAEIVRQIRKPTKSQNSKIECVLV